MNRILFLLTLVMVLSFSMKAQYYYDRSKNPDKNVVQKNTGEDYDKFFYASLDFNSPLSNLKYLDQTSPLGFKIGFRKRLNDVDRLWAGADFGWALYKQIKPNQTYTYGTQSITADFYNYIYSYSITANIDYLFFPTDKIVNVFGGVGLGVAYDKFAQYFNIYGASISSFGLQLRPEIGVLIGFKSNSKWRIKGAVHYDYASNTANLVKENFFTPGIDNYKSFTSIGFQIGIVKMAW